MHSTESHRRWSHRRHHSTRQPRTFRCSTRRHRAWRPRDNTGLASTSGRRGSRPFRRAVWGHSSCHPSTAGRWRSSRSHRCCGTGGAKGIRAVLTGARSKATQRSPCWQWQCSRGWRVAAAACWQHAAARAAQRTDGVALLPWLACDCRGAAATERACSHTLVADARLQAASSSERALCIPLGSRRACCCCQHLPPCLPHQPDSMPGRTRRRWGSTRHSGRQRWGRTPPRRRLATAPRTGRCQCWHLYRAQLVGSSCHCRFRPRCSRCLPCTLRRRCTVPRTSVHARACLRRRRRAAAGGSCF